MSKRIHIESTLDNTAQVYGTYTMTLRDRNGNILKQGEYPIRSVVNQYWSIIYHTLSTLEAKTYTGANGGFSTITHLLSDAGGNASQVMGILVGTSSSGVQYSDNTLGGYIAHGVGANQLSFGDSVVTYDASSGRATITRTFTNDNASTEPTVNEVCIGISNGAVGVTSVRDVPGSSYAMLYLSELTVSYEIQFPFGCQNFSMLFARHMMARNGTNFELYDSSGTLVSNASYAYGTGAFGFVGRVGEAHRGIAVGNSSAAEAFNTFALGTSIPHGTNAGDLFYHDCTNSSLEVETSSANVSAFYFSRAFINKSGSSVTINEVGLLSNATIGDTNNVYLFDRRVLSTPISVASDDFVTITWAYKYTFS